MTLVSSHWERGRIKWDTAMIAGATPSTEDDGFWLEGDDPCGIPFVAIADMSRRERVSATAKSLSSDGLKSRSMPIGQPGTLLFAMYASVGEVAFLGISATWNQALLGITPDPGKLDSRFLRYVLLNMRDNLLREVRSNTQSNLNARQVGDIWFQRPSLPEQRTIADYLDLETSRIDTLIEEQQRLVELLRERRTAVIARTTSFGTDIEFRRIIKTLRQGWSPNCESWPADGVKEWGVLKVGCANTGRFDPAENKRLPDEETPRSEFAVRRGEIVMSRSNTKDLVGAAAVVDGDYPRLLLSDLTYGISLTGGADPAFVAYALASARVRVQISAASKGMSHSMQKISQRDIRELRLQLPMLDEQCRIAAYLDEQTAKIDALVAESERFIELARERRSALITAAVTGQLDVPEMA